jgi:hypothetical protein
MPGWLSAHPPPVGQICFVSCLCYEETDWISDACPPMKIPRLKRLAIPIELYMALAICIVIEILGALVWRFLMIECGKEKSRRWEAEALENEGGTPFHSG